MSDDDSRWIPAIKALKAMEGVYATAMNVAVDEARRQTQTTILRYLAAGHWPAKFSSFNAQCTNEDGTARPIPKEVNFERDCYIVAEEYWNILIESGKYTDANWYLGEFDLLRYKTDEGTYSGFARGIMFDRNYLPVDARNAFFNEDSVALLGERTGDPGRPEKGYAHYVAEFERRKTDGKVLSTLAAESSYLLQWFKANYPGQQAPTDTTIANRLRTEHREWRKSTK